MPRPQSRHRLTPVGLALLSSLLIGGCAIQDKTRFPSLLPRAIENRSDAEPVRPTPVVEPDPALDAQIAKSRIALDTTRKDFEIAATRATSMARQAKGDAVGGERWIEAQTALAELDVYRAQASGILTDLEQAALARAADGKPDYPALEAARTATQAELDAETKRIGTLQVSLPEA